MEPKQLLFLTCIFIFIGCQRPIPQKTMWAGTLTVGENKQLPFQLFLDLNSRTPSAFFLNGTEQTPIPEIRFHGDSLSLLFSEYGAVMAGMWNGKEWRGRFFRFRSDTIWNEFITIPMEGTRQKAVSTISPGTSLVGKFQVYIPGVKGIDSTTTANFWAKNDSIFGTLIAPDGDYGLLAGRQSGSKVTLTRFTGWQAFVMELEQQGTAWTGKLYSRSGRPMVFDLAPQSVTAPEGELVQTTSMKSPKTPFTFSGLTPTGKIMNNKDELFRNKALLIDIMGTWCHNCLDAAPLLQRIHTEFGKDGLEVIGLAFEISDNPETAKKNLTLFQKRYGITYPLLFCGSTMDTNVEIKLKSQLNDFYAYPTTIFIDKKGVVKKIHVGFNGPGTGKEYQRQEQHYYELVKQILK